MKNPKHENFIPVFSLKPDHLPYPYRDDPRWTSMIQARAADTVKLKVNYTSPARPDPFKCRHGSQVVRQGTGTAFWTRLLSSKVKCPFPDCTIGGSRDHDVYGPFRIVTVSSAQLKIQLMRLLSVTIMQTPYVLMKQYHNCYIGHLAQGKTV